MIVLSHQRTGLRRAPLDRAGRTVRAHLVGIGGSGMRSLAELLQARGWRISGSDLHCDAETSRRFDVRGGHSAEAVGDDLDLVIHSDAVPASNVELAQARARGIRTISYPRMLARLMRRHQGVAIAGTHGKSTTTAMLGEILVAGGLDPTVVYGAAPLGGQSGGRWGRGEWMLVEACEYRANFRHFHPRLAAILSIEPDHFDCYRSQSALVAAFRRFAGQVSSEGVLLVGADCPAALSIVDAANCPCETFGFSRSATWQARGLCEQNGRYLFEIWRRAERLTRVRLRVAGRHNVLNALAAAALAAHCGATAADVGRGLEHFAGLQRRMELVTLTAGGAIYDDYAHHPSEVTASLATLRQLHPQRRVTCVFQPHQASRTRRLLDSFAHSLQNADRIIVTDIVRAREPAARPGDVHARDLVARIRRLGANAVYLPTAEVIVDHLRTSQSPGDVVVTMGAGNIGKVAHELGQRLRTDRQAG